MQVSARLYQPSKKDLDVLTEELHRLMNNPRINLGLLVEALLQSLSDGYEPSFVGVYRQAPLHNPDFLMHFPFVIGQTPNQKKRLASGILEGQCSDMGEYACVDGTITHADVAFTKIYDTSAVNPVPIQYAGTSIDGTQYEGTWHFNFPMSDMETQGTFTMKRIA